MTYQHLGIFSDWVEAAKLQGQLYPLAEPGLETRGKLREVLGFCQGDQMPRDVQVERSWESEGLLGEEVSWSVGYGPRTHAYLLRPARTTGPLPGIVALHDHGGFKYYGKEKIADGPEASCARHRRVPGELLWKPGVCQRPCQRRLRRLDPRYLPVGQPPISVGRYAPRNPGDHPGSGRNLGFNLEL